MLTFPVLVVMPLHATVIWRLRFCNFLELVCDEGYVFACSKHVFVCLYHLIHLLILSRLFLRSCNEFCWLACVCFAEQFVSANFVRYTHLRGFRMLVIGHQNVGMVI